MERMTFDLVLLMRYPDERRELTRALWAAFHEVEAFFNHDEERAVFRRYYLSEHPPDARMQKTLLESARNGSPGGEAVSLELVYRRTPPSLWQDSGGRYSGTYDALKIARSVREVLGEQRGDTQQIVIDQELSPPPNWRYIIWSNWVVSTVPTDPDYWRMGDPSPVATIKHRVRTACLCSLGSKFGLRRCGNERCFLYRNVDSFQRLDQMVELGREHKGFAGLVRKGFEPRVDDPGAVQRVIAKPQPDEGWWYYER